MVHGTALPKTVYKMVNTLPNLKCLVNHSLTADVETAALVLLLL